MLTAQWPLLRSLAELPGRLNQSRFRIAVIKDEITGGYYH
jgi:hypothetical protein